MPGAQRKHLTSVSYHLDEEENMLTGKPPMLKITTQRFTMVRSFAKQRKKQIYPDSERLRAGASERERRADEWAWRRKESPCILSRRPRRSPRAVQSSGTPLGRSRFTQQPASHPSAPSCGSLSPGTQRRAPRP